MKSNLVRRGFLSLLATQFFGAANDNVLKQVLTYMVTTGVWANALGAGGQAYIALCMTLPFIFLSGFAGQVADRHSKRSVMVAARVAEIPIALVAGVGLYVGSLWLTIAALLLLATQSTFFGPAKYGVIPELVAEGDLSRANGTLNMLTNVAIIAGTVVAGPIADLYCPGVEPSAAGGGVAQAAHASPVLYAPGVALVAIAIAGLLAVLPMDRLAPVAPELRYRLNPVYTYSASLREMYGKPIFVVALAWAFFYMIGMIALLILPEYQRLLALTYTQNSVLLGTLGVSIGLGSVTCGLISGHRIRPRLIPVGAIGTTVSLLLLGSLAPSFWLTAALLLSTGFFAGFYIVPLQALLQRLSPDDRRGRFLGTANALSFCFISLGALIYLAAVSRPISLEPNRVFLISGSLLLLWTAYAMYGLRRYIVEHASV